MGAYAQYALTFEKRIAAFSEQIQAETQGEYSVMPLPNGYVQLNHYNTALIQIKAHGLKYSELYAQIELLIKAFVLHDLAAFSQAIGV